MRRSLILLAVLPLVATAVPVFALPGFEAGARGMYWFPDLSANVKTTVGGVTGDFDAKTDLGVGDKNIPSGEAFVRLGNFTFRVGYTPVKFHGDKTLTDNVVFNGRTFSASSRVITNLDLKMLDGEMQFDILRPDLVVASFNLGLILKVKYVDGKVDLESSGITERKDFKAPIPMVGLAAGVGILKDMVRVDARAAGVAYSGNHLYEGDAFASFVPFPFLRLQGGYRIIDLSIDEDDIVAKLKLKGPYVGAQLSF
jgi:outer membrane protein